MKNAFTMLELTFVIVIIGILSAIAIPRLAATRDDAQISKARATVASVRNAIAAERQKRILRGDFSAITDLGNGGGVFNQFSADGNGDNNLVLEYPVLACTSGKKGCWKRLSGTSYQFVMPSSGSVTFTLSNNRFECSTSDANCLKLTQ